MILATAVVAVMGLAVAGMRIGGSRQMVALAAGAEEGNPAAQSTGQVGELEAAQQEAEKALEAARARLEQALLKLWTFDEETVRQVLAEAEQALADSRAKAGVGKAGVSKVEVGKVGAGKVEAGATSDPAAVASALDDALFLARRAKALADSTEILTLDSRAAEARGVWIDDVILGYMTEPDMLRGMVRRLAQTNVNVIYVWTYEMGRTTYPSQYAILQEPQFKEFEGDPMAVLVDEAHRQGIEVQAWLALFSGGFNGKPGPLLTIHPDWADVTRSGKKVSYYNSTPMNPAYPPAQDYLLDIVREIVTRYPVDGIHLDYIRYEDNGADDFGYHPWSIEQFRKEYGVDPRTVSRTSVMGQKWVRWRQDQVTGFVRRVRQLVEEIRPGTLVSAAVFAEPAREAAQYRFQDWPSWVTQGLLDQVVPMDYQPELDMYRSFAEADEAAVRQGQQTYWYQGIGQYSLSDDETARRIQLNRELGADGSVLFSMIHMKLDTYRTLQEGPWRLPAVLPTGRKGATEAAVAAELDRLADRLTAVYPAEGSSPEDAVPAPAVLPLVNRLRQVAEAARTPAPLATLQAQVADLQAMVLVHGASPAPGDSTALGTALTTALSALVPVTVEALQAELAYVQHLISLGLSREDD